MKKSCNFNILTTILSLDFEDIAIIEIIATAKIMAAIVPNSGITKVPIISISSAPAKKLIVKVLSVDVAISSKIYFFTIN